MSRRLGLRLVTARAADEVPETLAGSAAAKVLDEPLGHEPGARGAKPAEQDAARRAQAPALAATPTPSR
jgi:hypothetical protein